MIRASNLTSKELTRTQEKLRGLTEKTYFIESLKKNKEKDEQKLTTNKLYNNQNYNSIFEEKNSKENILFENKRKLQHIKLDIELNSNLLKKIQKNEAETHDRKKNLEERLSQIKNYELQLRKRNIDLKGDISAKYLINSNIINKIDTNKFITA